MFEQPEGRNKTLQWWLTSIRQGCVRVCRTDGREEWTVSTPVHVCVCWPVMMRHSSWSRASVKRRDTMSSGLMRKRISSWTNPIPVTPPPTILFAKSTCSTNKNTYSVAKMFSWSKKKEKKKKTQFHPWTWCEIVLQYRDLWYLWDCKPGCLSRMSPEIISSGKGQGAKTQGWKIECCARQRVKLQKMSKVKGENILHRSGCLSFVHYFWCMYKSKINFLLDLLIENELRKCTGHRYFL